MIEVRDLCFHYEKEHPILSGLNLTVEDGEWLAVIGPNGCGKSTFARHLNGLLTAVSGEVRVDGLDPAKEEDLWLVRERVAFLFQDPDNQIVAASVEDDVAFGPENLGLPREEIICRVEDALAVMGLTHLREKAPHELSGGEKQRVSMAGALAMQSRCMVLDEPTSMLDPSMRKAVIESLKKLHKELGITVIYITNVMEEVLLADRVAVLDHGKVQKTGTPAEIFADGDWLASHHLGAPELCRVTEELAKLGHDEFTDILDLYELLERVCKSN